MVLVALQVSVLGSYLPPVAGIGGVGVGVGVEGTDGALPSCAGVHRESKLVSAPDDHFSAGPDCGVKVSGGGRVGGAGA